MISTYYRVEIAAIAGTANAAGFVDATRVETYMMNGGAAPASYTNSTNKERANVRYKLVLENVQTMGNMYVSNVIATGATVDTAPTKIGMTFEVERGDSILYTRDELTPGVELSGANAIIRCVARALCETKVIRGEIYDPTLSAPLNSNAYARAGSRLEMITVGALSNSVTTAGASVTVTKLV
jgi:hypothetical protein